MPVRDDDNNDARALMRTARSKCARRMRFAVWSESSAMKFRSPASATICKSVSDIS